MKTPDYPKILELRANKALRSLTDKGFRRNEYELCKASTKYWVTYYGWLFNPLYIGKEVIPWVPFETQEEFFDFFDEMVIACNQPPPNVFRATVAMPKCREMGGSWQVLVGQAHDWCFHGGSHLILSRKEEEVDEYGNMDTPFEKIRYFLKRIPEWQLPHGFNWKRHSGVMSLENPNGGHIGGDSMSESAGAGGRVRSILFDDSAKVKDGKDFKAFTSCAFTSNLKFSVSTPEGPHSKLARLVSNEDKENAIVIWMKWWKDPRKMSNYRWVGGELTSDWNEEAKRTLDAETYNSQVACSFKASTKGGIYADQYKEIHRAPGLEPVYGVPITRQHDPGPHWFTLWTQILPCGCYLVFREEYFEMKSITHIAERIQKISWDEFEHDEFRDVGDPAGSHRKSAITMKGDTELKSEYQALAELTGINVQYGFMYKIEKSEWVTRGILACRGRMTGLCLEHQRPYLQIDHQRCPILHSALDGKYCYKVDHAGTPTGVVDEYHPIEDAADAFKYGPLAHGLYIQPGREKKPKRQRPGREWLPPDQLRRY